MRIISREDIDSHYSMEECIDSVKDAFALFSKGKVQVPLRTQIKNGEGSGTYLCMPAYCQEYNASCVKLLNMFPGNVQQGLPAIHAQVFVMDAKSGVINGMIDGNYLTQLRTGAASGAAFKLLAKKKCEIGALIGTGAQAAAQLEAMLIAKKLKEVRIAGLDFKRTQAFVADMQQKMQHFPTKILAVSDANTAVEQADLIVTVTSSQNPVFDGKRVKKGATISAVGSYQPHMQEIPAEVLTRASKIYFDSQEAVLSESGDILVPLSLGIIKEEQFTGEIGQVINGELVSRENAEEIILFKTVGIAAQDLIVAQAIFDKVTN
ncbi:ornithine cyclodeaminase family protein [Vagococcus entomophilus]|uniref:Ornithine cyclodeaminase family protein n=1 Tax=Vagococcus entomophilus TaxID=1160095 RepID=A0A430AJZ8_9ENTE|nr:ornithine cyclodeaminase family protein [Vagococcus entomophilus]RSU08304.1 ornithine cyclodeaminase family protein [Vagococcus entomophilus]